MFVWALGDGSRVKLLLLHDPWCSTILFDASLAYFLKHGYRFNGNVCRWFYFSRLIMKSWSIGRNIPDRDDNPNSCYSCNTGIMDWSIMLGCANQLAHVSTYQGVVSFFTTFSSAWISKLDALMESQKNLLWKLLWHKNTMQADPLQTGNCQRSKNACPRIFAPTKSRILHIFLFAVHLLDGVGSSWLYRSIMSPPLLLCQLKATVLDHLIPHSTCSFNL